MFLYYYNNKYSCLAIRFFWPWQRLKDYLALCSCHEADERFLMGWDWFYYFFSQMLLRNVLNNSFFHFGIVWSCACTSSKACSQCALKALLCRHYADYIIISNRLVYHQSNTKLRETELHMPVHRRTITKCYYYNNMQWSHKNNYSYNITHLMIKICETSFTQRFDDSMSSFSSEKRINLIN